MNILFATPNFGTIKNRTKAFLPLLAHALNREGHEITGIQHEQTDVHDAFPIEVLPVSFRKTPWWVGLWKFYREWRQQVLQYLSTHRPDVIVADTRCHIPTVQAACQYNIPVVALVVGVGTFRFNGPMDDLDRSPSFTSLPTTTKVQYPFVRSLFSQQKSAMYQFAERIVVSDFLRDVLHSTFGVESTVIRTPVPLEAVEAVDRHPEYITIINPRTKIKGGDLAVHLSERYTDLRFLIAGQFADESHRQRIEELNNVRFLGYVEDIRDVFSETEILVVPSRVGEGGPRVIGEAFANSVPVIGTNRGAIPEFIGDAGIVVSVLDNLNEWRNAINAVRGDYSQYSKRAEDRGKIFDAQKQLPRVEALLDRVATRSSRDYS